VSFEPGGSAEEKMNIRRAVITAAGRNQRTLPVQAVIDRDGTEKSVLGILVEEALSAGVEEIAVVVSPGDEVPYSKVVGDHGGRLRFIPQDQPLGYGHAVFCAREFTGDSPFLHLVGDHLSISSSEKSCARQLVETALAEDCAVSAVQATRENLLPYFGAVGGRRVPGRNDLYVIDTVIEKPTPTEAELRLIVPGLRAGHYLCFFGMHVLTPAVMEILAQRVSEAGGHGGVTLSRALATLAAREKYLALEERARRYDVGVKYGLLTAQLALALSGRDREEVLAHLVELLAQRS
jgi:UTP--glucose-1-phosphate uridylyltransferase